MVLRKVLLRVHKADSALLYALLEAEEGLVSLSTLAHQLGDMTRDIELQVYEPLLIELNEKLALLPFAWEQLDLASSLL